MSGAIIKEPDDAPNETFEKGIFRKIVRENWKNKISESSSNPKATHLLDEHAARMESIFGTLEYGVLCMPNIISNSKKMSEKELSVYLSSLEAIGIGYKYRFNSELTGILLAGLALKARDANSILNHLNGLTTSLEKKCQHYGRIADREIMSLESLTAELEKKDSGMFRFFRRGEVAIIKRLIEAKSGKIKRISRKREKYSGILIKVKGSSKR